MKTVLLCNASPNQRALAHRLYTAGVLDAIGIVELPAARRKNKFLDRLVSITAGLPLRRAWFGMLEHFERAFPDFPDVDTATHVGVNADSVHALIRRERPDLVLVSGTNLLKAPLIDEIGRSGRVLNLHTGISPYIKGGPNCTNWALALGEMGLIGNTVMWLDAGIDSGNIVSTERTPLTGSETLTELQIKVMDHAHDLYVRCVLAAKGGATLPSVPQDELGPGRVFLTRDWTGRQIASAVTNFYRAYRPAAVTAPDPRRLVPLG